MKYGIQCDDLHENNMIVTPNGKIKIIDFTPELVQHVSQVEIEYLRKSLEEL